MSVLDFLDMMPERVVYQPVTDRDQYGAPIYAPAPSGDVLPGQGLPGAPGTYRARVLWRQRRVANAITGQDEVSDGKLWIAGDLTGMKADDRFMLPDGSTPRIINWAVYPDETGPHHTEVEFGLTQGRGRTS